MGQGHGPWLPQRLAGDAQPAGGDRIAKACALYDWAPHRVPWIPSPRNDFHLGAAFDATAPGESESPKKVKRKSWEKILRDRSIIFRVTLME